MREMTYVEAINEALMEEMVRDEKVFIMGEDIGRGYGGNTAACGERSRRSHSLRRKGMHGHRS